MCVFVVVPPGAAKVLVGHRPDVAVRVADGLAVVGTVKLGEILLDVADCAGGQGLVQVEERPQRRLTLPPNAGELCPKFLLRRAPSPKFEGDQAPVLTDLFLVEPVASLQLAQRNRGAATVVLLGAQAARLRRVAQPVLAVPNRSLDAPLPTTFQTLHGAADGLTWSPALETAFGALSGQEPVRTGHAEPRMGLRTF